MRAYSLVVLTFLFCCLASAPAWTQEFQCVPCWYNFGKVEVGSSSSYSVKVSNLGHKTLSVTKAKSEGAFALGKVTLPLEIKPGTSVELPVIFTPTADGRTTSVLALTTNARHLPFDLHFAGSGTAAVTGAKLEVSPASLSFGNVGVGSNATLQATLTASHGSVTISSDRTTSSEFAIVGLTTPVTIASGKSIPVTIEFTPNGSGTDPAKVGFISNAVDSPTVEPVTGTGVAQGSFDVTLSWTGVKAAAGYNVFRSNAKTGPFDEINTALESSTSYTDNTVVAGSTYYYVTTAVNADGAQSPYSNVTEAVIPNN